MLLPSFYLTFDLYCRPLHSHSYLIYECMYMTHVHTYIHTYIVALYIIHTYIQHDIHDIHTYNIRIILTQKLLIHVVGYPVYMYTCNVHSCTTCHVLLRTVVCTQYMWYTQTCTIYFFTEGTYNIHT